MGAYLSEPLTTKESSDEAKGRLVCGASSMQGWRIMQEDAHNCILDYDNNTSLFAVYDGHGGAEVAKYCAQKLPQYIKDTEAYQNGNFEQALEEAFLNFDATIAEPEIIKLLKSLAGSENLTDEGSDEEENVHNLCEEARMPLEEVIAKYQNKVNSMVSLCKGEGSSSSSSSSKPITTSTSRTRRSGASTSGASSSSASSNFLVDDEDAISSSSTATTRVKEDSSDSQISTSNGHHEPESPADTSNENESSKISSKSEPASKKESSNDSPEASTNSSEVSQSEKSVIAKDSEAKSSGEVPTNSDANEENNVNEPKESNNSSVDESNNKPEQSASMASMMKKCVPGFYNSLLGMITGTDDDDDSDSNDENFESKECSSTDEEENTANGLAGESSDEDEVDDSSDEGEDNDEADDADIYKFSIGIKNEPGSNSGCTAVVALLINNKLYVANAGDSRCVVCRDGKAVDMSIDHKPEDKIELDRITKAGGKVSKDGRVNGGLNLSRAIGDLGYKQNTELGPKEQMITAFPDVKTLDINPETDSFIVLACDGIWNFMSSQNVVDFISERLAFGVSTLSHICEEMFDHCLAPNTTGDGTGCDNMTAVIIRIKPTADDEKTEATKKRPNDDEPVKNEAQAKRPKTENESVAVSSV